MAELPSAPIPAKGRRPLMTPEVVARLQLALRAGNTRKAAANFAGISPRALFRWLERGRKARKGAYWQFVREIERAEAVAESRAVVSWIQAWEKDWRACAAWLRARRPRDWNPDVRIDATLSGREGAPPIASEVVVTITMPDHGRPFYSNDEG